MQFLDFLHPCGKLKKCRDIVLPQHLKFSDLVPLHKNIPRIDGFHADGGYQLTPLSQYSGTIPTDRGAKYEVIAHSEYISTGRVPNGQLDLIVMAENRAIGRNTATGSPISQISRTVVGEFTANSKTTNISAFISSDVARTINIYSGYLRVMRIG